MATYLKCCILQNIAMFEVLVIVLSWSLLYTKDQSRSSGTGTSCLDFLDRAFLQPFKYSYGTFFRLKPLVTIFLTNPCQINYILFISDAESSHDWALYKSLLRTHASNILIRLDITILLSVSRCFSSVYFWKADEMRQVRKCDGSSSLLTIIWPRYFSAR